MSNKEKKSLGLLNSFKVRENRNYGIELLRILAMFMVVFVHVLGSGGITYYNVKTGFNYWYAWVFEIAAYCAVNIYALISGFVGYKSKHRYSSVAELWIRVFYYTVIFSVLNKTVFHPEMKTADYIYSFFPVLNGKIWYFTMYFCLFFFMPALDAAVNNLPRDVLKKSLIAIVTLFSVLSYVWDQNTFKTSTGFSVIWLAVLYLIGAYIGKYEAFDRVKKYQALLLFAVCIAFIWVTKFVFQTSYKKFFEQDINPEWFFKYTSLPLLTAAVCLLLIFRNLRLPMFAKCFAAAVAPLTFGVFVIHFHPFVYDNYITKKFLHYVNYPAPVTVLMVIGTAAVIFAVCALIDFERAVLFEALNIPGGLRKIEGKLSERCEKKKKLDP